MGKEGNGERLIGNDRFCIIKMVIPEGNHMATWSDVRMGKFDSEHDTFGKFYYPKNLSSKHIPQTIRSARYRSSQHP